MKTLIIVVMAFLCTSCAFNSVMDEYCENTIFVLFELDSEGNLSYRISCPLISNIGTKNEKVSEFP